jgi:hypothetical protein
VRWSLTDLYNRGLMTPGHTYRFYIILHDGDQTRAGGDCGQATFNYYYPGPLVNISGHVIDKTNAQPVGMANVLVTLTINTDAGDTVTLTTHTGTDGSFSFVNQPPGTYSLSDTPPASYYDYATFAGTVGGSTNGDVPGPGSIISIDMGAGDVGINYDFVDLTNNGLPS